MVSVKEAYKNAQETLREKGISSYQIDSRVILEHIINCQSGQLPLCYDRELTKEEEREYEKAILKRKNHIPVSYITHKKEFYGLLFYVDKGVLIPRPDTENLVDEALKIAKGNEKIADLCSGSGCIGLSLAYNLPKSRVTLFDVSDICIKIANKNKENLKLKNAQIIKIDLIKEELPEAYDMIVSNPPYIPVCDIENLDKTVREYEPAMALTDGGDGLLFYKRLKYFSDKYLKVGGTLLMEIGINQLKDVENIFGKISYSCDLAGIPRVVKYVKED